MRVHLQKVLDYFSRFSYRPSFEEIHTFFPVKITKKELKGCVDRADKYTVGEYSNKFKVQNSKFKNSLAKIQKVQKYLNYISSFPQIRLIGLSGSVAMLNAHKNDDIDLFIVTAKDRLWTGRFVTNIIAYLCGLKRSRGRSSDKNKVCLNLFFEESNLSIEKKLRTEYMAHEVLQMVPILDVNQTYRHFLRQNDWITVLCPNVDIEHYIPFHSKVIRCNVRKSKKSSLWLVGDLFEKLLKKLQLVYMSKPKGDERIERYQLWFHPRDYSRIMKSRV